MNLTERFLAFTLLGAEWVLWLLIGLSVVSVGIMIERFIYYTRRKVHFESFMIEVRRHLVAADAGGLVRKYGQSEAIEAIVACTGAKESPRGAGAAAEAMVGARARQRQLMERNLTFLATLGNNAPFIGLFGTVLGIIKAFRDLAQNSQAGAEAVMAGISEALVATAVGLLVAIPAVMAFNYFNRRVRTAIANSDAIAHAILAELRAERQDAPPAKGVEAA
jgi:biopolymer transport protein ExbB